MDGLNAPLLVLDSCTACGACLLTCPEHALVPTVPLQVRADRCTSCGECVEVCPADALVLTPGADHGVVSQPLSVGGVPQLHDRRTGETW